MGLLSGLGGLLPQMGAQGLGGLLPLIMNQGGIAGQGGQGGGGGGGLMGAFSGNPQFQQQLGSLMSGQGPGMQPPQFTPPITQMTNAAPAARPGANTGRAGLLSRLNIDPNGLPPWWQRQAG